MAAAGNDDDGLAAMRVAELRGLLDAAGVSHADCIEKGELVARVRETGAASPASAAATAGRAAAGGGKADGKAAAAAEEEEEEEAAVAAATRLIRASLRGAVRGKLSPPGSAGSGSAALEMDCVALRADDDKGESAAPRMLVFVMHGYGANAADLVPVTQGSHGPEGCVYVHPEGILNLGGGSRAWWNIDMERLMGAAMRGDVRELFEVTPDGLPDAQVALMATIRVFRAAAARLAAGADERGAALGGADGEQALPLFPLDRVVLAGFSQGAMISVDLALSLTQHEDLGGVVVFSGVGVAKERWAEKLALRQARKDAKALHVMASHGRQDPILPFALGEALADWLRDEVRAEVDFTAFNGPHTLGPTAFGMKDFLAKALERAASS